MKLVSVTWTETAVYSQTFEVDDDWTPGLHIEGGDPVLDLIMEHADFNAALDFVSDRELLDVSEAGQ